MPVSVRHALFCLYLLIFSIPFAAFAQSPALVGYWHNWNTSSAPYMQLTQVDSRYNVVMVAFAVPSAGTTYNMTFSPSGTTQADFIAQVQTLKNQGRRVGISIGGGGTTVKINSQSEENTFVNTMLNIINTYGFDAMDLDLESSSLSVSGGTIANPVDVPIIRMNNAVRRIMESYRSNHNNEKLFLTMAPETAYSTGGQSAWNGVWGAYLPIIHALRDSLDIMMVQLYNSGSMYGVDGGIYTQATADFIVSQTEAMIVGFNVDRWSNQAGPFLGLLAHKVAVALPACADAAGGGYTSPTVVKSAVDYLRGTGPKPGAYTRISPSGYPNLRGMMTWSVNWDAVSTCGPAYEFANNFETIFLPPLPVTLTAFKAEHRPEERHNLLSWSVDAQRNFSHFEVENSTDGLHFSFLDRVEQSDELQYAYAHERPSPGTHYYRLRMVDQDGTAAYSGIAVAGVTDARSIRVQPNPFREGFYVEISGPAAGVLIRVFDALGRPVVIQSADHSSPYIDLAGQPAGLYHMVYEQGGQLARAMLVKM